MASFEKRIQPVKFTVVVTADSCADAICGFSHTSECSLKLETMSWFDIYYAVLMYSVFDIIVINFWLNENTLQIQNIDTSRLHRKGFG